MLPSSTRCVSTTLSDSNEARTSNNPVRYLVGKYGLKNDSPAASHASSNEDEEYSASRVDDIAALALSIVVVASFRNVPCGATRTLGVALLSGLFWFPLPSEPQITRRIGNSFAQLLTSNAVLIAVGLAAVGGGRGWMF